MWGHSKWSTIKHQKAAVGAKRGKDVRLIGKEITLAAKRAGGNPEWNPQLRVLIEKAKTANVPGDNIQKAIKTLPANCLVTPLKSLSPKDTARRC
jgi:transcriptional/translational regulatory protein YebC/TACO1